VRDGAGNEQTLPPIALLASFTALAIRAMLNAIAPYCLWSRSNDQSGMITELIGNIALQNLGSCIQTGMQLDVTYHCKRTELAFKADTCTVTVYCQVLRCVDHPAACSGDPIEATVSVSVNSQQDP
jgi:hypothetical protein